MQSEDEEIVRSVAEHGWHAISVTDCTPGFVYTCGLLTTYHHPELIIFGLDSRVAYSILAAMVESLRCGRSFSEPGRYDDILEGQPIAIRVVHPSQHELYLGYAMGYCRVTGNASGLSARQVFWPDKAGHFPFESESDPDISPLQPRLGLTASPSELRAFRRKYWT
jgi:hypothetical protein